MEIVVCEREYESIGFFPIYQEQEPNMSKLTLYYSSGSLDCIKIFFVCVCVPLIQ